MIEFAMINDDGNIATAWINLADSREHPHEFWFEIHRFRIDGVFYSKWSEEFVDAFNRAIVWQKLND